MNSLGFLRYMPAKIQNFLELWCDDYIKSAYEILSKQVKKHTKDAKHPHGRVVSDNFCIVSDLDLWEKQCIFAVEIVIK